MFLDLKGNINNKSKKSSFINLREFSVWLIYQLEGYQIINITVGKVVQKSQSVTTFAI